MDKDVQKYIDQIEDKKRKADFLELLRVISEISPEPPTMWGSSIVAFGLYHYKYESGREGDAPKIGISNRKQAIVMYGLNISDENSPNYKLLASLGVFKTGKGCLYIASLKNIDLEVLKKLIQNTHVV